jgi:hypothetical protein
MKSDENFAFESAGGTVGNASLPDWGCAGVRSRRWTLFSPPNSSPLIHVVAMMKKPMNGIAAEAIEISRPVIVGDDQEKGDDQNRVDDMANHPGKKSDGPDDDQNDGDGEEHEVFEVE